MDISPDTLRAGINMQDAGQLQYDVGEGQQTITLQQLKLSWQSVILSSQNSEKSDKWMRMLVEQLVKMRTASRNVHRFVDKLNRTSIT